MGDALSTGPDDLVERLAVHRIVGGVPRKELQWVAAHATLRRLQPGAILTSRTSGPVEGLYIILSGQIAFQVDRANGRETIMEWHGGDVTGVLPYSRLTVAPGDAIAEQTSDIVVVHRDHLPALMRECPAATAALVHVMVDRARAFNSSDLRAEKMVSLGKLSAGLAHELNNPASAIARSARSLHETMTASEDASRALGALALTPEQRAAIDRMREQCLATAVHVVRSPLEQADREAALADWLLAHRADPADAEPLAQTAVALPMLDGLAGVLEGAALGAAVRWLAAGCLTRQLADDIEQAASRISGLVDAVKGFTHMDQNATAGPVDIAAGLAQTLAVIQAKARAKAVSIQMTIPPDLPRAQGIAGELNQVWMNLIDNALDAVGPSGRVAVTAAADGQELVVAVTDDGPGIPPAIKDRIFDPFFTTKDVGKGTGLGLDIVHRIVQKHRGTIAVESAPGRTQFRVTLPLAAATGSASA